MTNQKDIAKKQAEIVGQLQQFPIGRTNSGGRAGGMVEVVVTNPLPGQPRVVQAKCANDCAPGDVQLMRVDDGSYVALSPTAARKTSETTTRQVSKKESTKAKKQAKENIKILFYVNSEISPFVGYDELTVERLWKELWIGGTWPVKKIYTVPDGYRLADAFIVNTGEKEEDYVVMGRLFPLKKIHKWYSQLDILDFAVPLGQPAAIFFTIEKGVLSQQEFAEDNCPPYFWRYCGGGFFYSGGSGISVNSIDAFSGHIREYWPRAYSWYNGWENNNFSYTGLSVPNGNPSSFVNLALFKLGMFDGQSYYGNPINSHATEPDDNYFPILSSYAKNSLLQWRSINGVEYPPETLFGVDVSSGWYYKTKTIKNKNINTFYSYLTPSSTVYGSSDPGLLGFMGELCATPTKDFTINYQVTNGGTDEYAASFSSGFLYEPLVVHTKGDKTLAVKQVATRPYQEPQKNFLLYLSDSGESPVFTKILGIPELNNYSSVSWELNLDATTKYSFGPPFNSVLYSTYFNYLSPIWENTLSCTLKTYWYTGTSYNYSLSSNQLEKNKEILYLKDFLLSFARFTGLIIFPSSDIRNQLYVSTETDLCTYLKPLTSYIENSLYIPYGFIDSNKTFYGTQCLSYAQPEKTRVLPQSEKASIKIVELKLDEVIGQVNVAPEVKVLPIYVVTPQNSGSPTIALASTNYWFKTKSEGEPMPVFTPTPGEEPIITPTPTPSPSPTPEPTPTPTPTPGYGYGY